MERINYEKILFKSLSEGAFAMITNSEKDFADWIESIKYQSERCDELYYELKKYKDAEEQGLLLRLPCKVGGEVWRITTQQDSYDDYEYKIAIRSSFRLDMLNCIGKTVFLTYEEAELELANRQQSHAEAVLDERNGR